MNVLIKGIFVLTATLTVFGAAVSVANADNCQWVMDSNGNLQYVCGSQGGCGWAWTDGGWVWVCN